MLNRLLLGFSASAASLGSFVRTAFLAIGHENCRKMYFENCGNVIQMEILHMEILKQEQSDKF